MVSDGDDWAVKTVAQVRATLALTVGTDVQAYDAGLQSIAAKTTAADKFLYTTANDVYAVATITTFGRSLVDDSTAAGARTTLEIGKVASTLAGGRLTLQTGVGVPITDQTAKTTIYYTPFAHGMVGLYDGTNWIPREFTEKSLALGTLTTLKNYDVFIGDTAGSIVLEALAWTSDTARATALLAVDGVLVKTTDTSRRYVGTFRTASTTTTEDTISSRLVWNYNNRMPRLIKCFLVALHTYSTASWRAYNSSNVVGDTRMQFVSGLAESAISITINNTFQYIYIAMAMDSTTAPSTPNLHNGTTTFSIGCSLSATYAPQIGFHYLQVIESGISASSVAQNLYSEGIVFC